MKNKKLKLGGVLFALGLIGILSILTMELPLPKDMEEILLEQFTPQQIKWLTLINPTLFLLIAVVVGTVLYDKVKLEVPWIESLVGGETLPDSWILVQTGVLGGILTGVLLTTVSYIFYPMLPEAFIELGENLQPTLAVRFLYGGFTEEILLRFGLMTLVIWLSHKVFGRLNTIIYWSGILIAAVLFALAHFPIAYQAVANPPALLLIYVLIGNAFGGVIFGWLYWKNGLEAAMIAHVFTHIVMVLAEPLLG